MNNYDELKYKDEETTEAVISVNEPKQAEKIEKKKNISIFSVFFSAFKLDNFRLKNYSLKPEDYSVPVPKFTIVAGAVIIIVMFVMLIMNTFVNKLILIPLAIFFCSGALPIFFTVFFTELNTRKNINILTIILLFLYGMLVYAIIKAFADNLLVKIIYESYIQSLAFPLIFSVFVFFSTCIVSSVLKLKTLPECFLIAVCISLGFAFSASLLSSFSMLFVDTQISIIDKQNQYAVPIIINEQADLTTSFTSMMKGWAERYILTPYLYANWAVAIGAIVSMRSDAYGERRQTRSVYLLLMLVVVLSFLSVVDTNFTYFNKVLRLSAAIISTYISVKFLNQSLRLEIK